MTGLEDFLFVFAHPVHIMCIAEILAHTPECGACLQHCIRQSFELVHPDAVYRGSIASDRRAVLCQPIEFINWIIGAAFRADR